MLSTCETFDHLSAFMKKRERQLQGPIVVYALLHAGNLAAGLAEAQEAAQQSSMDQKPDAMTEMAAYAQLEQVGWWARLSCCRTRCYGMAPVLWKGGCMIDTLCANSAKLPSMPMMLHSSRTCAVICPAA